MSQGSSNNNKNGARVKHWRARIASELQLVEMLTSAGFSKDHRCLEGLFQIGARPHRGTMEVSAAQNGNCYPCSRLLLVPSTISGPLQLPNEHSGVYSPSNKQTEEKPPRSVLKPDRPWLAVKEREECDPRSHGHGDISSLVRHARKRAAIRQR